MLDIKKQWFVVNTYSGLEEKVKRNLEQRIEHTGLQDKVSRVIIPTEDVLELKAGKKITATRKMYPGYVLVQMTLEDESWKLVRNTPGVQGFIGTGNKPIPVSDKDLERIVSQMTAGGKKLSLEFRRGEKVKVTEGHFIDFLGTVDEVSKGREKVKVLLTLFGKDTSVELDITQVEKF